MTEATAISPRGRTSSTTGRASRTCPTSSRCSPPSRCTRSRPAATASATSRAIRSRAWPPTRSSTRGRGAELDPAVVDAAIPNSRSCRASSRSPSPARPTDRTAALVHDIGAQAVRDDERRGRLPRPGRRRPGPHADDRLRDPRVPSGCRASQLLRRHPARLQPLRAARQQVQGADQDPREGTDAGGVHAPGRSRMGARARRPRHGARRGDRAARRALRRPAVPRLRARQRRLPRRARRQPSVLALGRAQRAARTSARATRSSRCR